MKVLAGIVTYNPNIKRLRLNIKAIINDVTYVVIVDNGSQNALEIQNIYNDYDNIRVVFNRRNLGVAKALNQIGNIAEKMNCDFFITLDQDSVFNKNAIGKMMHKMALIPKVGIVAPVVNRNGISHFNINQNRTVITSGNLVRTKAWKDIGGFWNYLFIDEVDHEFCYRMWKNNYSIEVEKNAFIDHELGHQTEKKIFGHIFHPLNHSPFRRYFIARNCLIIGFLYPLEKYPYPNRKRMLLRTAISIFLCERNKTKKIMAMIKGIMAAKKWIKCFSENKYFDYRSCGAKKHENERYR